MQIFIKPAGGHKVRNPDNGYAHLPSSGDFVMKSPYWLRKIKEGAVEEVDMSKPAKPAPKPAPKAPAPKKEDN